MLQIKNGESGAGVEFHTVNTKNPFHNMSSDSQGSNPLYDLADFGSEPANPLYELGSELDSNDSSNPAYEVSTVTTVKTETAGKPIYQVTTVKTESPANPLYDAYEIDEAAEEVDLLSGTNELQEEEDDDDDARYEQTRQHHYDSDSQEVHEQEEGEVKVVTLEYQSTNGDPRHWAGNVRKLDDDDEDDVRQHRGSDDDEDDVHRGSDEEEEQLGRVEVVEEVS